MYNPFEPDEKKDKRRAFTQSQKKEILHQQNHKCAKCHKKLDIRTVEYDHIKAWAENGKTEIKNGAALCPNCHRLKTHNHTLTKVEKKPKKKASNPFEINLDFSLTPPKKKGKGGFGLGGIF